MVDVTDFLHDSGKQTNLMPLAAPSVLQLFVFGRGGNILSMD